MIIFRKAVKEDADELIDLINYVFSYDHRPHDFKKMNPHMYNSDYPFWEEHYVAEENGKLLSTLSVTQEDWNGMKYGHIGQVCVHPYHRGRGFMKKLMNMAIDDMKNAGFAFSSLDGLRQRYEYFGFTQGDLHYNVTICSSNLRHYAPDTTGYSLVREKGNAFTILKTGEHIGSVAPWRVNVPCADAPASLALLFKETDIKECPLRIMYYNKEELAMYSQFCENLTLTHGTQYNIFRLRDVIRICLEKRNDLWDGRIVIAPEDETAFSVTVSGGKVTIEDAEKSETTPKLLLQRQLYGMMPSVIMPEDMAKTNWFPLIFN